MGAIGGVLLQGLIAALSALLVAVVGALLAVRGYREQQRIGREGELRKQRGAAYAQYLAAYAEAERYRGRPGQKPQEPQFSTALLDYSKRYSALFQVAKDSVLIPTTEFHQFIWPQTTDVPTIAASIAAWDEVTNGEVQGPGENDRDSQWRNRWSELYAAMLIEMRRDAFAPTQLDPIQLAQRLPWSLLWGSEVVSVPLQPGINAQLRALDCECGQTLEANNDEELTEQFRQHVERDHPEQNATEEELRTFVTERAHNK